MKSLSAPKSSKPTPTPSIDASIRNANGFAGSFFVISRVETKAQFCSAAEFFCSLTNGVPITQSPRPGGVHFKLNKRSNASFADAAARVSDQGSREVLQ